MHFLCFPSFFSYDFFVTFPLLSLSFPYAFFAFEPLLQICEHVFLQFPCAFPALSLGIPWAFLASSSYLPGHLKAPTPWKFSRLFSVASWTLISSRCSFMFTNLWPGDFRGKSIEPDTHFGERLGPLLRRKAGGIQRPIELRKFENSHGLAWPLYFLLFSFLFLRF